MLKQSYIIIFNSPSESIMLLKILRKKGFDIKVVSAPCSLTSGCSRAINFNINDLDAIKKEIEDNAIKISSIYKKTFNGVSIKLTKVS